MSDQQAINIQDKPWPSIVWMADTQGKDHLELWMILQNIKAPSFSTYKAQNRNLTNYDIELHKYYPDSNH